MQAGGGGGRAVGARLVRAGPRPSAPGGPMTRTPVPVLPLPNLAGGHPLWGPTTTPGPGTGGAWEEQRGAQ